MLLRNQANVTQSSHGRCAPARAQQCALRSSAVQQQGRVQQAKPFALPSSAAPGKRLLAQRPCGTTSNRPTDSKSALEEIQGRSLSSIEVDELFDVESCPHGKVMGVMRANTEGVLTCLPEDKLQDIIPKLNKVTGMPVISPDSKVIGVISRKDIIKVRNGKVQGTMQDPVSKHMTTPAITISKNATVQQAADLMLANKIRRLPVVDTEGLPAGIVSRSDIFKPLYREAYDLYMEREKAALLGSDALATGAVRMKKDNQVVNWKIKYLYDGDCAMCLSLKMVLTRQDNERGLIKFINIADPNYNPKSHMGISYDEAMSTIHAIYPDGHVIQGTEALKALFTTVGLGWAVYISDLPIITYLVDALYHFLSANRLSLGGALDGIIAAKRMDMSKKGVETCGDVDEQCTAEW